MFEEVGDLSLNPQPNEEGHLEDHGILTRSIQDIYSGHIFLPKPTGENDSVMINEYIQKLSDQGGGTLIFARGEYRLDQSIGSEDGYSHVKLSGFSTTLKSSQSNSPFIGSWTHSHINGFTIDSSGMAGPCFQTHLDKTIVEDVRLTGWDDYAMKINDGTYGDLGLLNLLSRINIDQNPGYGIFGTYRFVDSWIDKCNIGSQSANVSLEGGPIRVTNNHLNGAPENNIELRGNKRITIANNILEGSNKESIVYNMPPWLNEDNPQIQIVGNAFSNGGKTQAGTYSAISLNGVDSSKKVNGFNISGNIFACEDPGSGWKYIINANHADSISASGNQWKTGYSENEPVIAIGSQDVVVSGNAGGNLIKSS